MNYYYGQDNSYVEKNIETLFPLNLGDIKYVKSENKYYYDFVGFVIENDSILTVFPKHYLEQKDISDANASKLDLRNDSKLLFNTLIKYIDEKRTKSKADKHFGNNNEFESDYPFHAFFDIYNYFSRYGIYYEEENSLVLGQKGKISWKHTLQHSNFFVINENLLYSPFYSKRNNPKTAFISECMVFVINYTLHSFPFFLQLQPINSFRYTMDFLANKRYVLKQLYQSKNVVFKDIHKRLIDSLICFFEELDTRKQGGPVHIKINYFNLIWQTMVNKYLNDCFVGVDKFNQSIIFDETIEKSPVSFKSKKYIIDTSSHRFEVELDHYGCLNNDQYVFDSKYYGEIDELNYKQFVYDELMDNYANQQHKINTHSALLLPGTSPNKLHLDLLPNFGQLKNNKKHQITEQYLNVKTIMKHYINS